MQSRTYLFTSESVSEGHPDKLADQISDAILDAFLNREATAKVACETLVADNLVVIAGEFRTADEAVFREVRDRAAQIARQVLADAGYTDAATGIEEGFQSQVVIDTAVVQVQSPVADCDVGSALQWGIPCRSLLPLKVAGLERQRTKSSRKSGRHGKGVGQREFAGC